MKGRIEVVEYDTAWPGEFEAEASSLARVFSGNATAIHHIGNTAVPGLAAKPTFDILVVEMIGKAMDWKAGS